METIKSERGRQAIACGPKKNRNAHETAMGGKRPELSRLIHFTEGGRHLGIVRRPILLYKENAFPDRKKEEASEGKTFERGGETRKRGEGKKNAQS